MRTAMCRLALVIALLLLPGIVSAAEPADRTLSPYFYVSGGDSAIDTLPLKESRARVDIAGVIARVVVTQVYVNEGTAPIEAVYVFPGSTRAAVNGMEMQVGERVIKAKIKTKEAATRSYEKARRAGKRASLLEQNRPNVFTMKVANIMPKDRVEVRLQYVETLVPSEGVYEFVYPTVVGPRYSEKDAATEPEEAWIENPHSEEGKKASYQWGITAKISAGMAIRGLQSPSHELVPTFNGAKDVKVELADAAGGNRDFVLRYRLSGEAIETGVLLFPGAKEKFFLAMVQPPKRVVPKELPAREYIFIVDVSGSMGGFPMQTTRKLMDTILSGLGPRDRLNLMMFSGGSSVLAPASLPATSANIRKATAALEGMRGGGSTRILQALKQALAMKRNSDLATSFVVVTDGYVSVEREAFELISKNLGKANLFAFGIGSSVNRHLVEGMARAGMGQSFVALAPSEAAGQARAFARYISAPVLTKVKLQFEGFDAYDVVPKSIPDVFAERPVLVFGKYRGDAKGRLLLRGVGGSGPVKEAVDIGKEARESQDNEALRYLWARHRIDELTDLGQLGGASIKAKVSKLGLRYGLMTAYTSFVAVDQRVVNTKGKAAKVRQALPLPKGVPNTAIGGGAPLLGALSGADVYGGLIGSGSGTSSGGWGYGVGSGSGSGYGTIGHGGIGSTGVASRGRRAQIPQVRSAQVRVTGGMDKNILRRYLRRQFARIRHCYEKKLLLDPKLEGKLVVAFEIAASGKVLSVSTKGMPEVGSCVEAVIKTIQFPKVPGGGTVAVTYPLRFQPK